jgi:hypothetical protein
MEQQWLYASALRLTLGSAGGRYCARPDALGSGHHAAGRCVRIRVRSRERIAVCARKWASLEVLLDWNLLRVMAGSSPRGLDGHHEPTHLQALQVWNYGNQDETVRPG